ncbi:MAG: hypothetical protein ACE5ID_09725 [Acidobacteriota bacterium]
MPRIAILTSASRHLAAPHAESPRTLQDVPSTPAGEPAALRARYATLLQKKFLLQRERDLKKLQLKLAQDDAPYLMLDLADDQIKIRIRTTTVLTVPLFTAEIEGERQAFSAASPPPDWALGIFHLAGTSGPPVKDDQKKDNGAATPVLKQPANPRAVTPEILGLGDPPRYPSRYTLLFKEGLAVTITGGVALQNDEKTWIRRAVDRLAAVLSSPETARLPQSVQAHFWIHLGLEEAAARSLYPSIFTRMRAFVRLPGDPRL